MLDRVPKLFFLLGGIYLAMDIAALLIIMSPSKSELEELQKTPEPIDLEDIEKKKEAEVQKETFSLTPIQIMKAKEFYIMW